MKKRAPDSKNYGATFRAITASLFPSNHHFSGDMITPPLRQKTNGFMQGK